MIVQLTNSRFDEGQRRVGVAEFSQTLVVVVNEQRVHDQDPRFFHDFFWTDPPFLKKRSE